MHLMDFYINRGLSMSAWVKAWHLIGIIPGLSEYALEIFPGVGIESHFTP
ncbi:unnamed protein product [marine sediment metagenome]|uniref:Uncharacterized protein n=1 Tax=marine sediment metagenome TaxID=412755 RepID=X0YCN7_9ZZZZ